MDGSDGLGVDTQRDFAEPVKDGSWLCMEQGFGGDLQATGKFILCL